MSGRTKVYERHKGRAHAIAKCYESDGSGSAEFSSEINNKSDSVEKRTIRKKLVKIQPEARLISRHLRTEPCILAGRQVTSSDGAMGWTYEY